MNARPGMEKIHTFRSRVLGLITSKGRLIAATERGVYRLDKNGKRWRKIAPATAILNGRTRDEFTHLVASPVDFAVI